MKENFGGMHVGSGEGMHGGPSSLLNSLSSDYDVINQYYSFVPCTKACLPSCRHSVYIFTLFSYLLCVVFSPVESRGCICNDVLFCSVLLLLFQNCTRREVETMWCSLILIVFLVVVIDRNS